MCQCGHEPSYAPVKHPSLLSPQELRATAAVIAEREQVANDPSRPAVVRTRAQVQAAKAWGRLRADGVVREREQRAENARREAPAGRQGSSSPSRRQQYLTPDGRVIEGPGEQRMVTHTAPAFAALPVPYWTATRVPDGSGAAGATSGGDGRSRSGSAPKPVLSANAGAGFAARWAAMFEAAHPGQRAFVHG